MRTWLPNMKYAAAISPVMLWRGTLLVSQLIDVHAKIYKNYMQLNCFKACCDPIGAINAYFTEVHRSAQEHGYYEFDRGKTGISKPNIKVKVGNWIDLELKHLAARLGLNEPDFSHFKRIIKIKPYRVKNIH